MLLTMDHWGQFFSRKTAIAALPEWQVGRPSSAAGLGVVAAGAAEVSALALAFVPSPAPGPCYGQRVCPGGGKALWGHSGPEIRCTLLLCRCSR